MAIQNSQLVNLAAGFRMMRLTWSGLLLTLLWALGERFAWGKVGEVTEGLLLLSLPLAVVAILRCFQGSPDARSRLWAGGSGLCIVLGLSLGRMHMSRDELMLGYAAAAFLFHLFALRVSHVLGLEDRHTELSHLLSLPIVTFMMLMVALLLAMAFPPLSAVMLFSSGLVVAVGPFLWIGLLWTTLRNLERSIH